MSWIKRLIEPLVAKTIEEEIDKALPNIIESHLRKRFRAEPDLTLTPVGWNWALALALTEHWPEVPKLDAIRWLSEYIEVPFGTDGYSWTAGAAYEIADEYVREFGEQTNA